jgi:hypothetical protein
VLETEEGETIFVLTGKWTEFLKLNLKEEESKICFEKSG